jgi:ketosteroid isomerase-like protein
MSTLHLRRACVFAAALTVSTACAASLSAQSISPETPPSVELPPALARVLTDYESAWTKKDAAALARLFAEDGWVLQPGRPPVKGRAAIERAYANSGGGGLSLRALAFETSGPVGYVIGAYAEAKGQPDIGKFTLTLRLIGDRWFIVSDMDNGNRR